MTSAVTNSFQRLLGDFLKADIDSDRPGYYLGLARAESFTEPTSLSSESFQRQARHTLQSVKTINSVSYVIPTVTWSSGEVYEQYRDDNHAQTNFYVINSSREVFLCIEQAKINGNAQGSTIEPTSTLAENSAKTFSTSDGYKWRFLYKISNLAYATYRTNSYTPVKKIISFGTIPEEEQQFNLQDSSVTGEILGIHIDSGGTGYLTRPVITIGGNGSGAAFISEVYDGKIVKIVVDSDGLGNFAHGSNYDYASVTLTGATGSGAVLRPIYAPKNGTSANPIETLRSGAVMIQGQFDGDETSTLVADNDFYQVVLMRGIKKYANDSDFTANTGNALSSLTLTSISGSFIEDETISNSLSTAIAKILVLDGSTLYYYQDEETGFGTFTVGETITSGAATASITAINNPDIKKYSGEILYINNISTGVPRETTQTEDIRIVINLG